MPNQKSCDKNKREKRKQHTSATTKQTGNALTKHLQTANKENKTEKRLQNKHKQTQRRLQKGKS
jgi:hypothetical protein